jgi:pre-mRNA cleavage complex 2 protein Pcf11
MHTTKFILISIPRVFPSSVRGGIVNELQFSPSKNKQTARTSNVQQSESLSPMPSHGIHLNP